MNTYRTMAIVSILVLLSAGPAHGQAVTTGIISGGAQDQSGAVLPGVTVTLSNAATGFKAEAVTRDDGRFRFLIVPSGRAYELHAELPGFQRGVISNIDVSAGSNQNFDIQLRVGELTEQLVVTAEAPLINTESSTASEVIGEKFTASLPLITRQFTEIAALFQGVQQSATDNTATFVQFHARGNPTLSNGYRIDGMTVNTSQIGRVGLALGQNAVAEVQFLAGGFQAEYGEQAGSMMNLISKSGTNQFNFLYTNLFKPNALMSTIKSGLPNQANPKTPGNAHFEEFSLTGRIIRDKLFFANSAQYRDESLGNLVSTVAQDSKYYDDHLKITYLSNPSNTWDITIEANPIERLNSVSPERSLESRTSSHHSLWLVGLKQLHNFSQQSILESNAFIHHLDSNGPAVYPTGRDFVVIVTPTGQTSVGQAATRSSWDEKRFRLIEKLTQYRSNHTFKLGVEYSRIWGENWGSMLVGNFTDRRPVGGTLTRTDTLYGRPRLDHNEIAAYAQDGWSITKKLHLEFGLRLDGQSIIGDYNWAPRVGLSYDPAGDARNRFYANWGFYYESVPGSSYQFGKSTIGTRLFLVRNPNANLRGEDVLQNDFRNVLAPGLTNPLVNAWSVGYDRRLPGDIRVGVTYAGNRQHRRPTQTRFSDRLVLEAAGRASYRDLELTWRKPISRRVELMGSYTRSRTLGDTPNSLTLLQFPYRYGLMDWHEPHVLTALGTVKYLGFDTTLMYRYNSGRYFSIDNAQVGTAVQYVDRQGRPAGRNIEQMPAVQRMDMTINRDLTFLTREKVRLEGFVQIINVPNRANILQVSSNFFSAGRPTNVSESRQIQFGVNVGLGSR